MRIVRGDTGPYDAIIESDAQTLTDVVKQRLPIDQAAADGGLRLSGDRDAAALLLMGW